MHIFNMCTNDLRKKKVSNMNTVGEIIVTKEVTFWQPSARMHQFHHISLTKLFL